MAIPTETYSMYNGEVTLRYNDGRHRYEVDIPSEDILKKWVPSSTGIVGKLDKSAALSAWAVNEMEAFVRKYWRPGFSYDEIQINKILTKGKAARFDTSKEATDIGTIAHGFFENYIILKTQGVTPLVIEDLDDGSNDDPHVLFLPVNENARHAINAFLAWEALHEIEYLWSERKVYSRKHHYAGTADAAFRIDGKLVLGDFKSSKRVYPSYFLQLASYAKALEEEGHERFNLLWTLRVPKDGKDIEIMDNKNIEFFDWNTKSNYTMSLSVPQLFKYFKGLRDIYQFDVEAKDLYGDRIK